MCTLELVNTRIKEKTPNNTRSGIKNDVQDDSLELIYEPSEEAVQSAPPPSKKNCRRTEEAAPNRAVLLQAAVDSLNAAKEPPQPDECRSFGVMMECCARSIPRGADRQMAMLAAHRIMVENSIAASLVVVPLLQHLPLPRNLAFIHEVVSEDLTNSLGVVWLSATNALQGEDCFVVHTLSPAALTYSDCEHVFNIKAVGWCVPCPRAVLRPKVVV